MKGAFEKKLHEIQDLVNEPKPEIIDALSSMDKTSVANSSDVRAKLEEKELDNLHSFIDSFSFLEDTFKSMFDAIEKLEISCEQMANNLSVHDKGVDEILGMTTSLHEQQEKQRGRFSRIHNFIDEYYLNEGEIKKLTSGDINEAFFEAFSHLEGAEKRTAAALATDSHSTCLTDAAASLSSTKERAYQRMYNWLHGSVSFFDTTTYSLPKIFTRCLAALHERGYYFNLILDEVSKVRQGVASRQFLRALSSQDSEVRALEATLATDPLSFCADSLAWIHQYTQGEAASLANLFIQSNSPNPLTITSQISKGKGNMKVVDVNLKSAMATICDAFSRPLELRLSQAIAALDRPADLYQAANLFTFYGSTFSNLCGTSCTLCNSISHCRDSVIASFRKGLSQEIEPLSVGQTSTLTRKQILDAIHMAGEIAAMHHQNALLSAFEVSSLLEGYITMLRTTITNSKESKEFKANALSELSDVCQQAGLQRTYGASILEEIMKIIMNIVDEEITRIKNRCRITEIYNAFTMSPRSEKLDNDVVKAAIGRFEQVVNAMTGQNKIFFNNCDQLENSELQRKTRELLSKKIVEIYRTLFDAVMNPANQFTNPTEFFKYTPDILAKMFQ